MRTGRGTLCLSAESLDAVKTRYELLVSTTELRVSKAWELADVALCYVGLSDVLGGTADVGEVLRLASAASGAAAMASSPRASDTTIGKAVAKIDKRSFVIVHERRPIDPMDFFRAFVIAAIVGDQPSLSALARAVDDVEPDPAYAGKSGRERDLFRSAFAALACAGRGDREGARALATAALEREQGHLPDLEEYRHARYVNLVAPLVRGLVDEDARAAVGAALDAHHAHFDAEHRRAEASGLVAWGPLALASLLGLGAAGVEATDYAPPRVLELLERGAAERAGGTSLVYEVPELVAPSLEHARLRASLTSGGIQAVESKETVGAGERVVLEMRDGIVYRFTFSIDAQGAPRSLLDAGELLDIAERERARMNGLEEGSDAWRAARSHGETCARAALALLGDSDELFRDRMTSPLGRQKCDEHPEKFTRGAIAALVDSFQSRPS